MDKYKLELYWSEIPVGKENAVAYEYLCNIWNTDPRTARGILHELSAFDNGDDYILIRSSSGKGFYRTDDEKAITAYRQECLNRGRNTFAPLRKINRVLDNNTAQYELVNNMRLVRESKGLKQTDVIRELKLYDTGIDTAMLSKMENSVCLPTPYQLQKFAEIYACEPSQLVDSNLYM